MRGELGHRIFTIVGDHHIVAVGAEGPLDEPAHWRVVLHEEDRLDASACFDLVGSNLYAIDGGLTVEWPENLHKGSGVGLTGYANGATALANDAIGRALKLIKC